MKKKKKSARFERFNSGSKPSLSRTRFRKKKKQTFKNREKNIKNYKKVKENKSYKKE